MLDSKRRPASTQAVSRKVEGIEPRKQVNRKDDGVNMCGSQKRINRGAHTFTYDNDGREIYFNRHLYERVATQFDAAGRRLSVTEEDYDTQYSLWISRWSISQSYDGDGQRLVQQENSASWPTLFLRSSVMGGAVVGELYKINGTWYKDAFVYAGGEIVAQQRDHPSFADEVKWMYTNPITGAQRGAVESEPDPLGTDQGLAQQQPNPPIYSGDSGILDPGRYADAFNGRFCSDTGAIIPCDHAYSLLASGSADRAPARMFNPIYSRSAGRYVGFAVWSPNAAAAGVGVGTGGLHGLNNNAQNTGWLWMGQSFSTQGGVGGVSVGGNWYSLGDFGYSAGTSGTSRESDKIKLTNEEVEDIRNLVQTEVAINSNCAQFLEKIAAITLGESVGAANLLNEGINRVKNTLGFHWAAYPGAGGVCQPILICPSRVSRH